MQILPNHRGTAVLVLVLTITSLIPVSTISTSLTPTTTNPSASTQHAMVPFTSYEQLHHWVQTMSCTAPGECEGGAPPVPAPCPYVPVYFPMRLDSTGVFATATDSVTSTNPVPNHSETNAQVTGVDELDLAKNDGTYLYTVTNNTVAIVQAYPTTDARLLARVAVNGSIQGILTDGNKLVIISQQFSYPFYCGTVMAQPSMGMVSMGAASIAYPIRSDEETTSLWIFDISSHSSPVLTTTFVVNGTLAGARLIGNYAYLVASQTVFSIEPLLLPMNNLNGHVSKVTPAEVYHSDIPDYSHSFTTVVGIDITQPNPTPTTKTFLIGTSSTIYVSLHQIYLTQSIWSQEQETTIHRISIDGGSISYEATGTVPGYVLNQFSMDEFNGYLRVATSNSGYVQIEAASSTTITKWQQQQQTNVYVLDTSLHAIGKLEGLSPGEQFYAARFFGDRAYLVTFQRADPLFVIGLQDPRHPTVLGQLSIPGVSDYLQPYDENHLIGFGKSATNVTWENAALFQGLKLSFFDVTDPSHPIDTSDYLAGDRGSDSPALTDHRSVLFERSLNLLVIPVEIVQAQQSTTNPWAYNLPLWQGAYVFKVTIQNGLIFRGGITHFPADQVPSWNNSNLYVTRAFYIGNVLYTVSNNIVKMNSLSDLSELRSVSLA